MAPKTPDYFYKREVTKVIREFKDDPNLTINFSTGVMNQHVGTDKQAKACIVSATIASAMLFGYYLNQKGVNYVFTKISRNTKYSDVLQVIDRAISTGTNALL